MTRILRDDIVLGRRPPGSRLVERDIAAELNVSRLPVREAIKSLVAEGVVVSRPRTWAVVREFTQQDIQDFAEVRESIETLIFVFAAERHDELGLRRLRDAYEREADAAARGDVEIARGAAAEFHVIAVELADNEMLGELISIFLTRLRWLFGQHDDLPGMAEEHRVIYDAMAARDTDALRTLIPQHLASGRHAAERHLRAAR
ncbi:GntR family transcriptional regulator [Microbacterium sp. 179-I 3D4 NHS]|uniref:GntR family transcriptional regulator n=1 Tax=Microbacterium sp. 179-I 3D4 NHS TaxID=3142381 RepID=UPI0039A2DD40